MGGALSGVTYLSPTDSAQQGLTAWQGAIGTAEESPRRRECDSAMGAVGEALDVVRLEGPDAVKAAALRSSCAVTAPGMPRLRPARLSAAWGWVYAERPGKGSVRP